MTKHLIKKIVNIWDPLGVYGLAPADEYDDIVNELFNMLNTNVDENKIKKYLISQYYNEKVENNAKVNELYELIRFLM